MTKIIITHRTANLADNEVKKTIGRHTKNPYFKLIRQFNEGEQKMLNTEFYSIIKNDRYSPNL